MTTQPPQELPELPEQFAWCTPHYQYDHELHIGPTHEPAKYTYKNKHISLYTADQMREYGRACIAASQAGRAAVPTPIKETDARDKDLDARRYDVLRTCRGMEHDPLFAVYDDEGHVLWGGDLDHAIDEAIIYAQDIYGDIPATPPLEVREAMSEEQKS